MIKLLFVGNSYVEVGALDAETRRALAEVAEVGTVSRLTAGGLRWVDHVERGSEAGSAWAAALAEPGPAWTWVILQEQSQIPGLDPASAERLASAEAAATLDGWAAGRQGGTVLMMTWGRRDGDVDFPVEYPDFPTMQARLADGYLAVRDGLTTAERPVWVAPVGLAWQVVYEDRPDLFPRLYQADESHPAPGGTWLAAAVIVATLTGADPRALTPPDTIDPQLATAAADAAAAVVLDGRTGGRALSYPWQRAGDTAPTTSGTDGVAEAPASVRRCGCATGGAQGWLAWIAIVLVGRRARR